MMKFIVSTWELLFISSAISMLYYVFPTIIGCLKGRPIQKIKFIEKAVAENSYTLGKVSCYLKKGIKNKYLVIEYAYEVNGKMYYLTYQNKCFDKDVENPMDSELLANSVNMECKVYYDKNNPSKAIVKREVFVSDRHFKKIRTARTNKLRNISKDWTEPLKTRVF